MYPKYTYSYLLFQFLEKKGCKFCPFSASSSPNLIKWKMSHNILSDGNCVIQINDCVPQSTRHKNCFSWILNKLSNLKLFCSILLSYFWQNFNKIIDGFILIIFFSELFSFHYWFWYFLSKYNPSLMSNNWSIPGWSQKGINMNRSTWSLGSHHQPTIGGTLLFSC